MTVFYAIPGRANNYELQNGNITHRYENQVAYIKCKPGWIVMLNVFQASIGPQPLNSRDCGIGTVLSELCLIDPDLNNMGNQNRAQRRLSDYAHMQELVTGSCVRLIGLTMATNPPSGANVYFSAAIRMGYGKMIVESNQEHNIYETEIARANYDSNTGIIQPCCGVGYPCHAYFHSWFFCDDVPGKYV